VINPPLSENSAEKIFHPLMNTSGVHPTYVVAKGGEDFFSIDMDALRAITNRFVMIYIFSYPELRFICYQFSFPVLLLHA
jgi:hypothetical protein